MDLTAAEIAAAAGGRVVTGDPARRFRAVTIDSRTVPPDALFVALPGSRVDGHDFVAAAFAGGAAGALSARPDATPAPAGGVVIAVDDTLAALQATARAWRRRLRGSVIGVAGSNGKTTTKETLARVLATDGSTFATPRNENSQIGAPLTLLATPAGTRWLVLELGTSAPGELARLAAMAEPDLAVVTAAYAEHLEWLGDVAGVVAAETEILDAMAPGALALVGSSEPSLVAAARTRTRLRVLSLGERADDDWRLSDVRLERSGTRFALARRGSVAAEWTVPLLGAPAAWAAAFAIAVASDRGLDPAAIRDGLAQVVSVAHRLVPLAHPRLPLFVVDDSYNSNPASCRAAIDTAVALSRAGDRLVLVLGDMLELGAATEDAHREVGSAIHHAAPRATVVAVGDAARVLADAARRDGVDVQQAADAEEASRLVVELVRDVPATVLAKGSRGIGLERVVDRVLAL